MIGTIENAIVAAIAAASGETLGYRLTTASYASQLDEDVRTVVHQFPAAWVAMMGEERPTRLGNASWRHRITFALVVAAQNLRNEAARRHGAVGAVGSYQMLQDLRALLAGQTFGLDIEELEPGRVQPLVNARVHEQHLSILTLDLHTSYQTTQRGVSDLDDFVTFHADWDLPPIDLVPPLPVADPDAADTVALHGDTD